MVGQSQDNGIDMRYQFAIIVVAGRLHAELPLQQPELALVLIAQSRKLRHARSQGCRKMRTLRDGAAANNAKSYLLGATTVHSPHPQNSFRFGRPSAAMSASTMSRTNSLNFTFGSQFRSRLALLASPTNRSTSAGRQYQGSNSM